MANAANKSVALGVLRVLRRAGHQALFAGGCVRDMLLQRRVTDYDVATDATPAQVRKLFRHVLLVGAKFGVAMVIVNRRKVEVTTFRSDVSYSDGRRPDEVRFTSPQEDALRRDFTINGMFYDPLAGEVIDYVRGREDLQAGIVRTIGSPDQRFEEDYLRMIRAVRFAVRLGFAIEPATAQAIARRAPKIAGISGERIFDELSKMLKDPSAAAAIRKLCEVGVARQILGELFADEALWQRAAERVAFVAARGDLLLSLAALLAELDSAAIDRITRRWGASNEVRESVQWMALHLQDWRRVEGPARPEGGRLGNPPPKDGARRESLPAASGSEGATPLSLADFKRLMAKADFGRLRVLWRFEEQLATGRQAVSRRIASKARGIPKDRIAPPPLLTGDDLKNMGLSQGPKLGQLHRALYDAQLNEQIQTVEQAWDLARDLIREL